MAEVLALNIFIVLVLLLVVGPLVARAYEVARHMREGTGFQSTAVGSEPPATSVGAPPAAPRRALLGTVGSVAPTVAEARDQTAAAEEEDSDLIDLEKIEGRVKASSLKKVGAIIDNHPEEALAIISAWMRQEGPGG